MRSNRCENGGDHAIRRFPRMPADHLFKALLAKIPVAQVDRFSDSVCVEHDEVSGIAREGLLFVLSIFE